MNPLGTIVGPLVAAKAVTAVTAPLVDSSKEFADVLSRVLSSDNDPSHADNGLQTSKSLLQQLSEKLKTLLGDHHPLGDSLSVELSPLGNVYIEDDSWTARQLEAAIAEDSELKSLISQYAVATGKSEFDVQLSDSNHADDA